MKFDVTSDKIILISYPSGGFGHFIYYVLTRFALETAKTDQKNFEFNQSGDSHAVTKYTTIWYKNPSNYAAQISLDIKNSHILVLCDNGINDDQYTEIRKVFTNAKIVRLIISDLIRPVIYKTCVYKAMQSDPHVENLLQTNKYWSDSKEPYAQRENFTLLYHNWPFAWTEPTGDVNIDIEHLINFTKETLVNLILKLNLTPCCLDELDNVIEKWQNKNQNYFSIYQQAAEILEAVKNKTNISLDHITDLHDQGYINFLLEKDYKICIPVWTYKNWFADTGQIIQAIEYLNEEKTISNK